MRRLRKISQRAATTLDEPKLSVAPLVDVCFLLLAYFMLTTTMQSSERDLVSELPRIHEGVSGPVIRLALKEGGSIVLNPGPSELLIAHDASDRELPALRSHLKGAQLGGRPPAVVIAVDKKVRHQRLVDVLDVLQELQWKSVGFEDLLEEKSSD